MPEECPYKAAFACVHVCTQAGAHTYACLHTRAHTHTHTHTCVRKHRVKVIEDLHIALLVVTVVLALGYVFFVLRPYLRMLKHEVRPASRTCPPCYLVLLGHVC